MNTPLRALIFDVDGTLADTEECHRLAFNAAFAAAGLNWNWDRTTYRDLLRVAGGRQRMRAFAQRTAPDIAQRTDLDTMLASLHRDKTRHYDTLLREQPLALRPGIVRLFDEAGANGIALAIATTTTPSNLDALLEPMLGTHWHHRFAVIVCGNDVANLKPAPDAYVEALRQLHVGADEALAFEDSVNGIRSAHAAGLAVIATPTWYSLAEALPPALITLAHLGDPHQPLPAGTPGAPFIDLACLRAWHADHIAVTATPRICACC